MTQNYPNNQMQTRSQGGAMASPTTEPIRRMLAAPNVKSQFENALGDAAPGFIASIIDLAGTDNKIAECDPKAVMFEALKAATLNLPLTKAMGFAYLVPFKVKGKMTPCFQIGYKGYIQLAMRTAQYRIINADVVYDGEFRGNDKLTGALDLNGTRTGDVIVGYFCHFELLNGYRKTLYMSKDEVMAHAKRYSKSYGYSSSPWQTNFDEMAIKTTIRRLLSKWGIMSVQMQKAYNTDNDGPQEPAEMFTASTEASHMLPEAPPEPARQIEPPQQQQPPQSYDEAADPYCEAQPQTGYAQPKAQDDYAPVPQDVERPPY